jgi:hypothetical protein
MRNLDERPLKGRGRIIPFFIPQGERQTKEMFLRKRQPYDGGFQKWSP